MQCARSRDAKPSRRRADSGMLECSDAGGDMRIGVLALVFLASAAHAGAYLEMAYVDLEKPDEQQGSTKFWAQSGLVRAETGDADGSYVLFRDGKLISVQPDEKRYRVIDKATMDRMGQHLADARKQMEARLAQLPPEQRAAMEQMLQGQLGAPKAAAALDARETSRSETVAGHDCKIWELYTGKTKEQELCVAAPGSLPGGDELYAAMKQVAALTEGLGAGLDPGLRDPYLAQVQRIGGVPILTRDFQAGKASDETRLVTVRSESLPASTFELPAGFSEEQLNLPAGKAPPK
jgi:hypothetical protein